MIKGLASLSMVLILVGVVLVAFPGLFPFSVVGSDELRDVPHAAAAEHITAVASAGCQQVTRSWLLFVASPSQDQLNRGIDISRSVAVASVDSRVVFQNSISTEVQTDAFNPDSPVVGIVIVPSRYGTGMWEGTSTSGGNPNELSRCSVYYDIYFNQPVQPPLPSPLPNSTYPIPPIPVSLPSPVPVKSSIPFGQLLGAALILVGVITSRKW